MNSQDLIKECEQAILEKRFEDAIGLTERALQKDANDVSALYLKARALSNSDSFQEALIQYDRLLRLVEDDPGWQANALISKSDALIELNRLDEAEDCLDRALGIKPGLARGWIHKARIEVRRENFKRSLEFCDRAISMDKNDPRAWTSRAHALYRLKKYKKCIQSAEKALSIKPDYEQAFVHMARAYLEMGKIRELKECEQRFMEVMKQRGPMPEYTEDHRSAV
jgi:tetratricopeptide (TPR) repeat protein